MMKQSEAEQIYLHHLNRTKDLINSIGDNPQTLNAWITNAYTALFVKNPTFTWFSLGTIVSGTVGKNIQVATQALMHSAGQADSSKIIVEQFSMGNQAIFKNIVSLFLTYESLGLEGVTLLANSEIENPFKNEWVMNAMRDYSLLQVEQRTIAHSLGLSMNDSQVITQLFSSDKNIQLAHSIAMGIAYEEQKTVQIIYKDELVDILLDPVLGWAGHQAKLDGITVLEKTYYLFDYVDNPADLKQRLQFAEVLLSAIDEGMINGQFLQLQSEVFSMANCSLWIANPYANSSTIGGINGIYWGQLADEYELKMKDNVLAFIDGASDKLNVETIIDMINENDLNIFPSVFSGEYETVKIEVDPFAYFLATNPNDKVIAYDIDELLNSLDYHHPSIAIETIYNNPEALNILSHNGYNPYWNQAAEECNTAAINHDLKSITVDKFMDVTLAPMPVNIDYHDSNANFELTTNDVLDNANSIFHQNETEGMNDFISNMTSANRTQLEWDSQENNIYINIYNDSHVSELENGAIAWFH